MDPTRGGGSFFARIKKTIADVIDNISKSIKDLFSNIGKKKTLDKAEDAIRKNPELKNKKVKVKDYSKVHVLSKKTQQQIKNAKSKEEVDRIMADYKKKRNGLIGAGAALAVVTVGTLIAIGRRGQNKTVSSLNEVKEEAVTAVSVCEKSTAMSVKSPTTNTVKTDNVEKSKATAIAEVARTEAKDTAEETKCYLMVIPNATQTVETSQDIIRKDRENIGKAKKSIDASNGKFTDEFFAATSTRSRTSTDDLYAYKQDKEEEIRYGKILAEEKKIEKQIGDLSDQERNLRSSIARLSSSSNSKQRNRGKINELKNKLNVVTAKKEKLQKSVKRGKQSREDIRDSRGTQTFYKRPSMQSYEGHSDALDTLGHLQRKNRNYEDD